MFEASASHPNATADDIRRAAEGLANLEPAYKERAARMLARAQGRIQ